LVLGENLCYFQSPLIPYTVVVKVFAGLDFFVVVKPNDVKLCCSCKTVVIGRFFNALLLGAIRDKFRSKVKRSYLSRGRREGLDHHHSQF
jgi:hypothetical protein